MDFLQTHFRLPQKVRRNSFPAPYSLKINVPFLITQYGGSGASGGQAEKFPPLPPFRHMSFLCTEINMAAQICGMHASMVGCHIQYEVFIPAFFSNYLLDVIFYLLMDCIELFYGNILIIPLKWYAYRFVL